ncbi:anthranilate phosphoribosyltransferase [Clostridium sp. BJN0001]|uniref:anthranilate phosphoribosyltransferase n=1 Tax=Clostridium sp. BJN0001 TaxID=2930219 RepID=UPI001FD4313A|nr:anthranilate phosphoribosyltransferase [Clostridium sp. BJN0001]
MKELIKKLSNGQDLTMDEAEEAIDIMLSGKATEGQIGSFLTALKMKGETIDEIVGCSKSIRNKALHIKPSVEKFIDFVGTGGDGISTFNISTTSAIVVAASGLAVAKHGNRSVSSKSGAADVLESLGVNIMNNVHDVEESVNTIDIGFMFAPIFNESMKYVGKVRKDIGIRSVFNILGPLSNPSGAKYQLIGVYNKKLVDIFAKTLKKLKVESALIVNADDGMDEISLSSDTNIADLRNGEIKTYKISPEDFGFKKCDISELKGGDSKINAEITKKILSGEKGPKRDIVLLNAGAALYAGQKVDSIEDGIKMAIDTIDSEKALKKLNELIEFSNR